MKPSSLLFTRRHLLSAGGSASLLAVVPFPVKALVKGLFQGAPKALPRKLWLYNTHTGETLKEVFWHDGKYDFSALKRINHLLRDHRANKVFSMNLQVLELMAELVKLLDYKKPLDIISGYRCEKTNAFLRKRSSGVAKKSYHTLGKAVDIHFRGLSLARARKAACCLRRGGVGYYPSSGFIHVDIRKKPAFW